MRNTEDILCKMLLAQLQSIGFLRKISPSRCCIISMADGLRRAYRFWSGMVFFNKRQMDTP